MGELREALAVKLGRKSLRRPPDPNHIIKVCQNLLVWDQETDNVSFIHSTAGEFIAQHFELWSVSTLAALCLTYLAFDVFENYQDGLYDAITRTKEHKFYGYAAQFWGPLAQGDGERSTDVHQALIRLFSSENKKRSMFQTLALSDSAGIFIEGQTLLHVVSELGLGEMCMLILTKKLFSQKKYNRVCGLKLTVSLPDAETDIYKQDELGRTPLIVAAERGHANVVDVLLRAKAKVDTADVTGRTALHWAAWQGREKVVDMLLLSGANVNVVDAGTGRKPLDFAIEGGHEKVRDRLLEAGGTRGKKL